LSTLRFQENEVTDTKLITYEELLDIKHQNQLVTYEERFSAYRDILKEYVKKKKSTAQKGRRRMVSNVGSLGLGGITILFGGLKWIGRMEKKTIIEMKVKCLI
jgi:hypothetical protein